MLQKPKIHHFFLSHNLGHSQGGRPGWKGVTLSSVFFNTSLTASINFSLQTSVGIAVHLILHLSVQNIVQYIVQYHCSRGRQEDACSFRIRAFQPALEKSIVKNTVYSIQYSVQYSIQYSVQDSMESSVRSNLQVARRGMFLVEKVSQTSHFDFWVHFLLILVYYTLYSTVYSTLYSGDFSTVYIFGLSRHSIGCNKPASDAKLVNHSQ